MLISQDYQPVVITLESREEVYLIQQALKIFEESVGGAHWRDKLKSMLVKFTD